MKPMLATIGSTDDLDQDGLIYEPKLDGIRALCKVNQGLKFISRNGNDITKDYPEFQFREAINATSALLDGEIVVFDEQGNVRFELWQQGYEATYVVFDILNYNGKDLCRLPLGERKKILDEVVIDTPFLQKCFYTSKGKQLWAEIRKRSMEGVMAKEVESLYYPGKRKSVWRKIKSYNTLEAVIIGYTTRKRVLSSLLLGIYDGDALRYIVDNSPGMNSGDSGFKQ